MGNFGTLPCGRREIAFVRGQRRENVRREDRGDDDVGAVLHG
jgi:hypothetical protein